MGASGRSVARRAASGRGLVALVVGVDAAAAPFFHIVNVAVDRSLVIAGHETPAGESCKCEHAQQRHGGPHGVR